jgi:hypothetical protein
MQKISQKRWTGTLHTNKEDNPARRYNNSTYICTEHGRPHVHKTNTSELKEQVGPDIIIVGNRNTPLSSKGHPDKKNQQRYPRTKQNHGWNGLNRHLYSISFYDFEYTFFSADHGTFSKIATS